MAGVRLALCDSSFTSASSTISFSQTRRVRGNASVINYMLCETPPIEQLSSERTTIVLFPRPAVHVPRLAAGHSLQPRRAPAAHSNQRETCAYERVPRHPSSAPVVNACDIFMIAMPQAVSSWYRYPHASQEPTIHPTTACTAWPLALDDYLLLSSSG